MTKLKTIIILFLIFVVTAGLSFYFEDTYQKTIRNLYCSLTYYKISFEHPRKYFHFASDLFVISFGLYMTLLSYILFIQTLKQKLINGFLTLIIFPLTVILYCYFDASIKLIECTACDDGTRVLTYGDIHYDKIFVISLITSLLPVLTTELKKRMRTRKQDISNVRRTGYNSKQA